jgi:hypothetical protein
MLSVEFAARLAVAVVDIEDVCSVLPLCTTVVDHEAAGKEKKKGKRLWEQRDCGTRMVSESLVRRGKPAGSGQVSGPLMGGWPGPPNPGAPIAARRTDRASSAVESMNQNQQLVESNNNTALIPSQDRLDRDPSWRPILHASNQVVLYNPTSHALTIHRSSDSTTVKQSVPHLCPYCSQPLTPGRAERDGGIHPHEQDSPFTNLNRFEDVSGPRASNYFQLLQVANDSASRPPTPPLQSAQSVPPSRSSTRPPSPTGIDGENVFTPETMAEGYFKAFFQEEARLGMGANGSVFLCQVRPTISNRFPLN